MAAIKSIEEKAKAYDEAIKVARKYWNSPRTCIDIDVLPELFPEIKEVDDKEIRKGLIAIITNFDSLYLQENYSLSREEVITWLEKQGEQKPAEWSKEDERDFDVIYGIIYNSCNAEDASRLLTWFKAIKDRVQPKQEWSNWDKTIIESIEALCDEKIESVVFQDVKEHVNDIKDWLKSLRPQNTWKPSEEQIVALKHASNDCSIAFADMKILATLYEQLKALHHYEQDT